MARYATVIMRYPSGRYGIVGSVPVELTQPVTTGTPQWPPTRESRTWATEQDVAEALEAIGIMDYQRAIKS